MTTCIIIWDEVEQNRYGDEYQSWHVSTGDDELEPTGKVYNCSNQVVALDLARKMATDRHLTIERLD